MRSFSPTTRSAPDPAAAALSRHIADRLPWSKDPGDADRPRPLPRLAVNFDPEALARRVYVAST